MIYKTLSLKDYKSDPYATLVAIGKKTLETRTWRTHYRGTLLIHSSMSSQNKQNAGKVLCAVDLVDIYAFNRTMEVQACCEWYPNSYAWQLENLRILTVEGIGFHKMNGKLSVYETELPDNYFQFTRFNAPLHCPLLDPANLTGWRDQYAIK